MALYKKVEHNSSGYRVPAVPRASRSARGRVPSRTKSEDVQTHPFEILASVAGNILQKYERSTPENSACAKEDTRFKINSNCGKGEKLLNLDLFEQGTSDVKTCVQGLQENFPILLNEPPYIQDNPSAKMSPKFNTFDLTEKGFLAEKFDGDDGNSSHGSSSSKTKVKTSHCRERLEEILQNVVERELEPEVSNVDSGAVPLSIWDDPKEQDYRPCVLDSQEAYKKSVASNFLRLAPYDDDCNSSKVSHRDNDKKSSRQIQLNDEVKDYCPPTHPGCQRVRTLSASRHRRLSSLKDGKVKPAFQNGSMFHPQQHSQKSYPFKKRKHFRQASSSTFGIHMFDSSGKKVDDKYCDSAVAVVPTSLTGQQVPHELRDCNVQLSIKSFKIPELFIEMPAASTVGSLKRAVMEAVSATLGDGLHVGILVQGKKVKDDSKTLLQSGIFQDDELRSLRFLLEPGHEQITPTSCKEDPDCRPGDRSTSWGVSGQLGTSTSQPEISNVTTKCHVTTRCTGSDRDKTPSVGNASTRNIGSKSRGLVTSPARNMEALAVVPYHRKFGNPEFAQRRIRRPFTVSEVEALVKAVEKLGTGRWRDVKLCAFDSSKHRTYVDLKDKWKTLVHTARISPQQRRGEPVPQELLDRVLAAHAYWTQQQTKQQGKAAL